MITFDHVSKAVRDGGHTRTVLSSVTFELPTNRRIALLGGTRLGKRMLIDLVAGVEMPTAGHISRHANVSFPVGDLPGVDKDLSVRLNVAHMARLYAANVRGTIELVESLLDVGPRFDRSLQELSGPLRKVLGQIVAFALPFDMYLLPDDKLVREWATWQGGDRNGESSNEFLALFGARLRSAGMIIATADREFAEAHCEMGLFMHGGRLALTEDMRNPFLIERQRRRHLRPKNRARARLRRRNRKALIAG